MSEHPDAAFRDRSFLFLGGLHRSGTSLLFRMLREHPEISGFRDTGVMEDEGQLLQTVYPAARKYGGPGKFGFDSASFMDETSPLVSEDNARRLFSEWSRYWNLDARLLLEKSPPNLVRARFLQALFPRSHFIMLLRHPVAVAYATQKWSRTSIPSLIEHWVICHERFADDRRHLRSLFTLKYEHLVRGPGDWMRKIHEFLGVKESLPKEKVDPDVNGRYFERWREAVAKQPASNMKPLLDRLEGRVNRFGYSLVDMDDPPAEDFFSSH